MNVTAAACYGTRKMVPVSLGVPNVGSDDGLLRVEACGICGTDVHIYDGILGDRLQPLILGHEIVGSVIELGDRARSRWNVGVGDRVFVQEFLPCFRCDACSEGQYALCWQTDFLRNANALRYGATPMETPPGIWGGFSEILYLHPSSLITGLPAELSSDVATLLVPISNGIEWITEAGGVRQGESVAVFGPGQHGLGCVVAAHDAGADRIVAIGRSRDEVRLSLARGLGATDAVAIDMKSRDQLRAMENSFDLVVDTTGSRAAVAASMEIVRPLGRLVLAGSGAKHLSNRVNEKSLLVRGVRGRSPTSVSKAVNLLARRQEDLKSLCTHSYVLGEAESAMESARMGGSVGAVHVNVIPN